MFEDIPMILGQEGMKPVGAPTGEAVEGQPADPTGGTGAPGGPGGAGGAGGGKGGGFDPMFLILMVGVFMLVMIISGGGQRKEKKRREAMLAKLAKGDKVQTIGGIIGTAIEVRENEVVIKVDENNNTRMKFARSAIQSVVDDKE